MNSPNFDLSTDERKKLLQVWQRRSVGYLKLLLALGTCTVIAWHIYPLVDDLDYNLMVPIRLPFTYQSQLRYPITYFLVIIVFSYMSYFVMVNDLIIQAHVMHLLCQYTILGDCFKHILRDCKLEFRDLNETQLYSNKNFQQKYKKRLGDLIRQHKYILNNTSDLRDILSPPMLAQLAVSTTLICSIGYQLVATSINVNVTKWLMSLLYLGYNMFGLYILCRWCEEVKIQSKAIGDAVYFSGWEEGITQVPGVRSSIILILARCNKPLVLSAGGMYDLSLEAYATMVKTSYSALTVLLRFRQN
ncbi:odorant receptor 13a-like [Pieris napi]|uniref:odorant receptor 13a-like n=1 Tax=Pieris napi TaxID=78633 RepID=UPI001FBBED01|nr:odorant receptor 13a-like [Pieris napi]